MGYYLYLKDKEGNRVQGERRHDHGNMLCLGGDTELSYNITYNYAPYFAWFGENGIRELYGKTGKESISIINGVIDNLLTEYRNESGEWKVTTRNKMVPYFDGRRMTDGESFTSNAEYWSEKLEWEKESMIVNEGDTSDYWLATAANAIKALEGLLELAKECSEGVWYGD